MIKKYLPLVITLLILYLVVYILITITLNKNNGQISYPLDDTFIHMAIAKNFALHSVWGITRYEFSSTTSSPLYTFFLAIAFYIFGSDIWIPFIVNLLFASFLLILIHSMLRLEMVNDTLRVIILLCITFLAPFPILVISGMEHILHTLLTIWFVYLATEVIYITKASRAKYVYLTIIGVLLVLSRYEGLFIVFAVCCFLFIRNRKSFAIQLGSISILPVIIYGLISVNEGSFWLPNSVLLKGQRINFLTMAGIESLYSKPLLSLAHASWLFTLTGIVVIFLLVRYFILKRPFWDKGQIMILLFLSGLVFHLELAQVGWVYRYEAYLMTLGILIVGMHAKEILFCLRRTEFYTRHSLIILFCLLLVPIVGRGFSALKFGPQASNNIYEQQYQMGRFLKKYYNGQSIAANDIGAINFLADLKCLDIVGLGTIEIAKAKREGRFSGEIIEALAEKRGVRIAIVYDRELGYGPIKWIKVGEWEINNNVVGASNRVSFYSVNSKDVEELKFHLKEFTSQLPKTVSVKIFP